MRGVEIFVGVTQYGKTTLALDHAKVANDRGQPYLVVDCMPAENFKWTLHAADRVDVLRRLYGKPAQNVVYTPKDEEDVEWIFGKVHEGGVLGEPRTVLWDECSFFMSPQHVGDNVSKALRGWAHSGNAYLLVTQRPADLHGVVFITSPEVYVFRLERSVDLERVQKELSIDPRLVFMQDVGQYQTYRRNRNEQQKAPPAPAPVERVGTDVRQGDGGDAKENRG
jgi:hypothetical protein